jgi:hypothetical protein
MRTYLLAFLLLCALPVLSQDNEESDICTPKRFNSYLEMAMEGDKVAGYNAPGYVVGPGVEIWVKSFNVNLESAVSTIDKTIERSGTTYRVIGNAYLNLKTDCLIGGGCTWGKVRTNAWSKQSGHPLFERRLYLAGWRLERISMDR